MPIKKRPSWDEYFMSLAHTVKSRSNCIRLNVGVVVVRDKRIITTGYNGTPTGIKNCNEGGCERCLHRDKNVLKPSEKKELCICIHAEQNALLQAAYHGVSTKGAIMYSTVEPCIACAKHIANSGVKEVVYEQKHSDRLGTNLLQKAKIKVRVL